MYVSAFPGNHRTKASLGQGGAGASEERRNETETETLKLHKHRIREGREVARRLLLNGMRILVS
jgi:hypothetical protein